MSVAILGSGPAGLLAAHAAVKAGHSPTIYARGERSVIHGAQFLHVPILDVTSMEPDAAVNFDHWGCAEEYAMKVYGDATAPCSWRSFEGEIPIWSMQEAYARLWMMYKDLIVSINLTSDEISMVEDSFEHIISTIPGPALCKEPAEKHVHQFTWANVWVTDAEQERIPYNGVVLNGIHEDSWYRSSNIMGYGSTEWPGSLIDYQVAEMHAGQRVMIQKPLANNCTCRPEITRAGRFGEWRKGILVHHAYDKTQEVLSAVRELRR